MDIYHRVSRARNKWQIMRTSHSPAGWRIRRLQGPMQLPENGLENICPFPQVQSSSFKNVILFVLPSSKHICYPRRKVLFENVVRNFFLELFSKRPNLKGGCPVIEHKLFLFLLLLLLLFILFNNQTIAVRYSLWIQPRFYYDFISSCWWSWTEDTRNSIPQSHSLEVHNGARLEEWRLG